jgi:hypothetical protein
MPPATHLAGRVLAEKVFRLVRFYGLVALRNRGGMSNCWQPTAPVTKNSAEPKITELT